MAGNPYLAGYESFLRVLPADNAPNAPAGTPQRPAVPVTPSTRTVAPLVTTQAPQSSIPTSMSRQQLLQLAGEPGSSSGIDITITGPANAYSSTSTMLPPPAPAQGGQGQASSVHITAMPSSGMHVQQPAVEITFESQAAAEGGAASALQGLTVQQMLDLDVDSLAIKIDRHHCATKKSILDHFMEFKARLMQAQNDAIEEERRQCTLRVAAKDEELRLARADLDSCKARGQRLLEMLCKACDAYDNAKQRGRNQMLGAQTFYAWRQHAMASAQRRRRLKRAEDWYTNVHLKKNVLRAWFRVAQQQHRLTLANRYQQELDNAKRALHEQYQGQISDLERLLAEARAALDHEAELRARMEDDMKRRFMRGVCALNIEAMGIMKRGAPPGGVNPFPTTLPPAEPPMPAGVASEAGMRGTLLSEPINVDVRGSITLSPTRLSGSAAVGGSSSSSVPQPPPVQMPQVPQPVQMQSTYTGTAQISATGVARVNVVAASVASRQAGGSSGRPAAAGLDGGPNLRATAQTFYQKPAVTVTRGPAGEVPKPRTGAPLPMVRQL